MFFRHTVIMAFLVILSHVTPCVFGLKQESFGNSPISPHQDWPDGVEALIKSAPRIYSLWVNGDERFYYAGDEETLNNFLKFFATIKTPIHLVIIDEDWNKVKQSHGNMARYDWILSVPSGIYRAHIIKEKGGDTNKQYPSVSIAAYSDRINFSHLILPENIKMTWSKDGDPNKAPSGKNAIIAAQQWSKALAAWNEFANHRLEKIRAKEIDPSHQWMEIKSEALSTWLPNYRFFVETVRTNPSSTFALDKAGTIFDLGRGEWSSPMDHNDHTFRNEPLTKFLKNNHLTIADTNAAISAAKLVEELSFTAQRIMGFKYSTKNFRLFDPRIYRQMFYKETTWRYSAEKKDGYWQIEQKYIGPPACIIVQPQWRLIVDANNCLSDVYH